MTTQPDRIDPAGDAAAGSCPSVEVLPPERHDGWTPARQARFLRELAASHCVAGAARAAGMSRQSAYRLRNRLKGEPFDIAWQAAFRMQYDALAEAALERAINGVEVPHFYKGELIHTSRRYDERATVALLALRERLVLPVRCWRAEAEGLEVDDFETLVARVEHGDELWDDVECVDEVEQAGEGEGESEGE